MESWTNENWYKSFFPSGFSILCSRKSNFCYGCGSKQWKIRRCTDLALISLLGDLSPKLEHLPLPGLASQANERFQWVIAMESLSYGDYFHQ